MNEQTDNPFILAQKISGIGAHILYEPTLDSTNTKALELLNDNVENGTVLITDYQTHGRGRGENAWHTEPGLGLTFSVILYPHLPVSYAGFASLVSGIAISKALENLGITSNLKWPNDIYHKDKKLGGILCESHVQQNRLDSIVIGIGINVNENQNAFMPPLDEIATSLAIISSQQFDRVSVFSVILTEMNNWVDIWARGNTDKIIETWSNLCRHLDKPVKFKNKEQWVEGVFTGLSKHGEAIIRTDSGVSNYSGSELKLKQ